MPRERPWCALSPSQSARWLLSTIGFDDIILNAVAGGCCVYEGSIDNHNCIISKVVGN